MRHVTTVLIGAAALSFACILGALADEIAAPAKNWTGFYVGGNVGYGSSSVSNDFAVSQPIGVGGFLFGNATLDGSDTNRITGAIGGLQLGYNWQANNYLLGIEADSQASSQKNGTIFNSAIINTLIGTGVNPAAITYSNKLEWFSTLRGRVGFISGPSLFYWTGGLGVGRLNTNGVITPTSTIFVANLPGAWDQSTTKIGWTIGVGVESAFAGNWSWKVEYLHLDLGSVIGSATLPATNCYVGVGGCFNATGPGTGSISSKFTDDIVRVGLNYKLGN